MRFLLMGIMLITLSCNATKKLDGKQYQYGISFGSKCCGTASDDFLKAFIAQFQKQNHTNLIADIAAGCGREGEFIILIALPVKDSNKINEFEIELTKLIHSENEKNQSVSASAGIITLVSAPVIADYSHCRIPLQAWPID